jgi:hypothetical protein
MFYGRAYPKKGVAKARVPQKGSISQKSAPQKQKSHPHDWERLYCCSKINFATRPYLSSMEILTKFKDILMDRG